MGLDIHFFSGEKTKKCADRDIEMGYFRKVNPLLYWIDRNVQSVDNCKEVLIPKHKLEELLADLNRLTKENCIQVYPTADGFFYGSIQYDQDYWSDVERVKNWINSLLKSFDFNKYNLFLWAWW
ncbi:hypothetical protein ACNFJN_15670 [Xenorhabdus budapestensis]|uniref:hypothetical protein n=1 Tax=Xenorhabdus budapestensis TaxID=290110 RepID=UPI003A87CD94